MVLFLFHLEGREKNRKLADQLYHDWKVVTRIFSKRLYRVCSRSATKIALLIKLAQDLDLKLQIKLATHFGREVKNIFNDDVSFFKPPPDYVFKDTTLPNFSQKLIL